MLYVLLYPSCQTKKSLYLNSPQHSARVATSLIFAIDFVQEFSFEGCLRLEYLCLAIPVAAETCLR